MLAVNHWKAEPFPPLPSTYGVGQFAVHNKNIHMFGHTKKHIVFNTETGDYLELPVPKLYSETGGSGLPVQYGVVVFKNKLYLTHKYVEIYDTVERTWSKGANYPGTNWGAHTVLVEEGIYCIGGGDTNNYSKLCYRYDILTNTWHTLSNKPTEMRKGGRMMAVGRKIYCFGNNAFEVYDIDSDTWTSVVGIPSGFSINANAALFGSKIYLFGGTNGKMISFDTESGSFLADEYPVPSDRIGVTSTAVLGNKLYFYLEASNIMMSCNLDEAGTDPEEDVMYMMVRMKDTSLLSGTRDLQNPGSWQPGKTLFNI